MSTNSAGFICGIFHPKLVESKTDLGWQFRKDEQARVISQFLYRPVLWEHEGERIGRIENIKTSNKNDEMLCYINVYENGKFVLDKLKKNEVLGLSVGYESDKLGPYRIGKFDGKEISLTSKPAMKTTWVVAHSSGDDFYISKTGVKTLSNNSGEKKINLKKSQIKMSEQYKKGEETMQSFIDGKDTSKIDVEQLQNHLKKVEEERDDMKQTLNIFVNNTIHKDIDQLLANIKQNVESGVYSEDVANALRHNIKFEGGFNHHNVTTAISKIKATASIDGNYAKLNREYQEKQKENEDLRQANEKLQQELMERRKSLHESVNPSEKVVAQFSEKDPESTKRMKMEEHQTLNAFLSGKSAPLSNFELPKCSDEDVKKSLEDQFRMSGI